MKKTIFNIIGLAILGLATISDSGCNQPAGYQPVTVASQQASQQAPQPCVETYPLQQVLAGVHGVDAYGRPLNAWGYPVNVYGEPIETVPCPEVFYHQPGSIYVNWLGVHYGFYHPVWGVSFFHPYYGPTVIIHRSYSTGTIRSTVNYRQSTTTVTTHAPAITVRPGASNVNRPVTPTNAPIRPAAQTPATAGHTVTPTTTTTTTSAFRRPTPAPVTTSYRPSAPSARPSAFRRH